MSTKAVAMTLVVLLACFVLFAVFLCSLNFPYPPALCRYLLVFVLFRPCSSRLFLFNTYVVLLAAFLIFLHHIIQNSCRLFSFFFVLSLFRPDAGIFLLVFELFRPCSSYRLLFSTYVVLLAAFLIFLHHILQNSCQLFCLFNSDFSYFSGLACFVVFTYQVR